MKNSKSTYSLGSLDLQQSFHLVNRKTIYRTITYGPSFANLTHGKRFCFNSKTGKAKLLSCKLLVEKQ
jgi:hypothetical protein